MDPVTLYKRIKNRKSNKPGKVQVWSCWVEMHYDEEFPFEIPCIMRQSGQQGGKQTIKQKYIKKGKNIGKSNETTPYEQACFEANNSIKEKIEDNMVYDINDIDLPPKYLYPALAVPHNIKKTEKLLKERGYLYVQPKLNGARCWKLNHLPSDHQHFETPTGVAVSRTLKSFDAISHIDRACDFFGQHSPDGEVFNPDFDFQTIISLLKKYYAVGENPDYPDLCTEDLQYHVYDLAEPNMQYEARMLFLSGMIKAYNDSVDPEHRIIHAVPTHRVESIEEIDKWNEYYILLGYEGLIIRDPESEYAFNDRNDSLIKYKKFYDDEFEIIGFSYEEWHDVLSGVIRKLVLWRCVTKDGLEFTSRPKGSFLARERMYKTAEKEIGKMLTVRYQELSQDGVPIMNVGINIIESEIIRDYE